MIERWRAGDGGLDRMLAAWGREHRFAGSGDRRSIADLTYDAVRRLRSAGWIAGLGACEGLAVPGRSALIGSLRLDGARAEAVFTGEGHAPSPLAPAEAESAELHTAPIAVRLDLPDWLMAPLAGVPEKALARLRSRAALHLRVNRLKTDPDAAGTALAAEGIATRPGPLVPDCLEVTDGARRVSASRAFAEGLVEVQDAASQAVAALAAASPGETVLDLCAGGGGKTLAMAAAMAGRGRLIVHDINPRRLDQLGPRAARAGAVAERLAPGDTGALDGACDLVLVDAPCSGSGAWARNPDAKWRLNPVGLAALQELQDEVLDTAARAVRPGGRLVYATCSLIEAENGARIAAFLARAPGWRLDTDRRWTPLDGGDGFYAAVLLRP